MDKERLQELAALHAAGALDGPDAEEYRRLVAGCAFLRHEIDDFNEVSVAIARSAGSASGPSPSLKERILQQIGEPSGTERVFAALRKVLPAHHDGYAFLPQAEKQEWRKLSVPGAFVKLLSFDQERGYAVALGKLDPGCAYPSHHHHGGEDLFMLSGDLSIGGQVLRAGDYHHAEAGTTHPANTSEHGCTLLMVMSTEAILAQLSRK